MYKIAILDEDKAYLERLIFFLKEHHRESFEISAVNSLDDLDQEVTQYNALFFSDDVAVDAALFPADIVVGYLTEKSETDEQCINKYQSMEQIYRRMMKLCEEGKNTDINDSTVVEEPEKQEEQTPESGELKAETVTVDGETYRIYYIEEDQLDRLAIRMLTGNRIKGLFQTEYQSGGVRIRITRMKSLYEYIQKNNTPRGKEQLLKFFADMITTALSLEEYMLSADRLMLDPREIYVNHAEDRVLIPYIPVKCDEPQDSRQYLEQIRDLCNVLIEGISEEGVSVPEVEEIGAEESGSAEDFDNLQQKAKESLKLKETTKIIRKEVIPFIVRRRTRERIVINRNLFKLGKDASYVDYCIKDNPAVSRNHADIVRKPDGFYLVDKGSLNHTFVNGKKLAADEYRKLENGCLIQLADEVFEFRLK
ncbi:MAG: FHA domain-containing protein [Lachnospiraceae bacterium]|nr:FHA domain-containing protein [Lachnospiraceae bacterium]